MSGSKPRQRRRYLVNYRYQLSQTGVILVSHLLVALCMTVLLSWFYLFMLDGSVACNHNRELPWYVLGMAVGITLATTWWVIRHSHRVAGVALKINTCLQGAACGNFPPREIAFRQKDHFPELAHAINNCLKGLQSCHDAKNTVLTVLMAIQARLVNGQISSEEAAEAVQIVINEIELL